MYSNVFSFNLGDLDSPMPPDQKGYTSFTRYLNGYSEEDRKKWREEVLSTTTVDFTEFAKRLSKLSEKGSVVVFGSESALKDANANIADDAKKMKLEHAFDSLNGNDTSDNDVGN